MAELILSLLGPVQVTLSGRTIRFRTRKAQAVLLYLASEASVRRETLLSLLWEDYPERSARQSLRTSLSYLRKAIPEVATRDGSGLVHFVLSDKQIVRINPTAAYQSDLTTFTGLLQTVEDHPHDDLPHCDACLDTLRQAVELYRGDFLADFYLPDSSQFENWTAVRREEYRRQALYALESLAEVHLAGGQYDIAEGYARRQLEFDNLRESAHRQLMNALALTGRRRAALSHFETCRQLLQDELGIEPSAETHLLYDAIAAGELEKGAEAQRSRGQIAPADTGSPLSTPAILPPFLDDSLELADVERDVFVARERELAQLDAHLEEALSGHGRVVFISGEAGQGKTALLRQFARRAQVAQTGLIVTSGNCNAYAGVGDPYLPFRQVMTMLNGDVEAQWAARTITRDQALRLWNLLPLTAQGLVHDGPDLIDVFVPGNAIVERATMIAPAGVEWLEKLKEVIRARKARTIDLEQRYLRDQVTNVLIRLAAQHPLLITLDDLQWADAASISLLFHLGRRLKGNRILIVGTYRPDEVALGLDGERHPLEKLLSEFKRTFGDVWVELVQAEEVEGQGFVDVLLDTEANRLGKGFRQALFRKTRGHPLFTIELLRAMQARGDLVQNEQGVWIESPVLDWQRLPTRIEGVLEERFSRLEEELREVLAVASVEGESFTAEVVARVQGVSQRHLLRLLSQELVKRHRLVLESAEIRVGRHSLSRYQFTHILFRQYLYDGLSAGERRLLHGEIAQALEVLYEGQANEIANRLAHHFLEAGEREKAIEYSRRAAGRARTLYAFDEAAQHLQTALDLLESGRQIATRITLLEDLADAQRLLRHDVQAISLYQSALDLCASPVDTDKIIVTRLHRKILQTVWAMKYFVEYDVYEAMSDTRAASRTYLESHLEVIEGELPQLELVHVLTTLANDAGIRSPVAWDAAERYALEAVNLAEQLDAPVEMSDALQILADAHYTHGNLLKQLELLRQALGLSRDPRFGDVRRRINMLMSLTGALSLVGEYSQAIPYLSEAENLAVQIGAVDRLVQVLIFQALCWFRRDRWDELFRVDERRRDLERRYTPDQIGASCLEVAIAAAALALMGDIDQASVLREQAYTTMVRSAGGSPENWSRSQYY